MLCKVEIRKNNLPSFACDGRKKILPQNWWIGKIKSCSPKKDKNCGKKRESGGSNHNLQDQAAAPYHRSSPPFVKQFGIILYILISMLKFRKIIKTCAYRASSTAGIRTLGMAVRPGCPTNAPGLCLRLCWIINVLHNSIATWPYSEEQMCESSFSFWSRIKFCNWYFFLIWTPNLMILFLKFSKIWIFYLVAFFTLIAISRLFS